MAPIVHGLEDEYGGQMIFSYLDIDDPANDFFQRERWVSATSPTFSCLALKARY
jgi:hypothetical protein